eukprot:6537394-Prymnesium_polylepis.1
MIPIYFYYRWRHTIRWDASAWLVSYQALTCALETYGALNVLLLGLIRFRCPWAPACPMPPDIVTGVSHDSDGAARARAGGAAES